MPVFADVDPVTLNLDPEEVERRITPKTRAIMPVHLFGRPAALAELAGLGLPLIEDAAQAFGAAGIATTGVASTFSFFPTKNLFCARRRRPLRLHRPRARASACGCCASTARATSRRSSYVGYNSRLDELQAAVLRLYLTKIDGWNAARREAAARYAELGLGEFCELPVDEPGHVYHMYVVRTPERDRYARR